MIKVYIAVLTMGNVHYRLSQAIGEIVSSALSSNKYSVHLTYSGKLSVAENRNEIVRNFLKSDCDYLLMIDSDNPPTKSPLQLIEHKKDVIILPTPIYRDATLMFNVFDVVDGEYKSKTFNGDYLVECDRGGTGCILIARHVLEKIKTPFKITYNDNGELVESEDMFFTRSVIENGFRLWTDWGYICHHYKTIDLLDVINIAKDLIKNNKNL